MGVVPVPRSPQNFYCGPEAPCGDVKREHYRLKANETSSIEDYVVPSGVLYAKNGAELRDCKDQAKLVKRYEEMITDHLERRVAVLFQQLVVCYKTGFELEQGKTLHQGASALPILLSDPSGNCQKLAPSNAAHASTIPCIYAKHEGKTFVLIKGASVYNGANTTLNMPHYINKADIQIDEYGELRKYTIDLLNKASQGNVNPQDGLKQFVAKLLAVTQARLNKSGSEGVNAALEMYVPVIGDIQENLSANEKPFEQMLGVQIDADTTSALLRKKICLIRYKAIQDSQFAQSQLVEKIYAKAKEIKRSLGNRAPNYYREAFLEVLRGELSSEVARIRLDKLFAGTKYYQLRDTEKRKNDLEKTISIIRTAALPSIHQLAQEVNLEIRTLAGAEILRRGAVTRELRNTLGLTQKQLASKVKALYPSAAASQSTISRIETNDKIVTSQIAFELADVFKVDPVLFMPAEFFSS
jgi:DNA-binding XRE family transcriptional regulator